MTYKSTQGHVQQVLRTISPRQHNLSPQKPLKLPYDKGYTDDKGRGKRDNVGGVVRKRELCV